MPTLTAKPRLLPLLLLFGLACSDDEPSSDAGQIAADAGLADTGADLGPGDAGPPDLGAPDLGLADTGPPDLGSADGGSPPDLGTLINGASCAPCGSGCPSGSVCLTAQSGESFCADRCDDDAYGCLAGFWCQNLAADGNPPQNFCVPPGATCQGGVGFGTPCFGGTEACMSGLDHCEGDAIAAGYCTDTCADDSECPVGYSCGAGDEGSDVCLADEITGAQECARTPGTTSCATHYDCDWGSEERCIRTSADLPGICAPACAGTTCPTGLSCAATAEGDRCLPAECSCHAQVVPAGTRDLLAEALAAQGMTRCDAIHGLANLAPNPPDILYDPYRLSFFDEVTHEPLRAPQFGRTLVSEIDAAGMASVAPTERAAQMVEALARRLDRPVSRVDAGTLDASTPLVSAIVELVTAASGTPDRTAIAADAADLPADLRAALARVVEGMTRALRARQAAFPTGTEGQLYVFGPAWVAPSRVGTALDPSQPQIQTLLNEEIDYTRLFGGGADLLSAIATADLGRFAGTPTRTSSAAAVPLFDQVTPIGRIIVGSAEPDIYLPSGTGLDGDIALLVDLGGDDVYRLGAGGNQSYRNPVAVQIDLGGDDFYGYVEVPGPYDGARLPSDADGRYRGVADLTRGYGPISYSDAPRQGGARAGIAVTLDLGGGSDHYRSLRMSQGSGIFGVGTLVDDGGDDTYELEAMGQGAGSFGIGLAVDLGGRDIRRAYHEAQGFGYARGAGLAFDLSGDDDWLMNVGDPSYGGDPLYFSAQRPGLANTTVGQGFGFGRRADTTDRAFFSGGVGLLVDATGDDRYEASVFAQGGGYWFGTGILADHAGNDSYDALWYAMGTGAHYALGLLLEGAGNDSYGGAFPRVNVTIAGAHDYTTAFLIDESGNDIYSGSRISIGAGNVNGLGFFVDNAGDDQYALTRSYGLGGAGNLENTAAGNPRHEVLNLGVFIDAAGMDSYSVDGMPFAGRGDDLSWISSQSTETQPASVEKGTGIDGTGESSLHAVSSAE